MEHLSDIPAEDILNVKPLNSKNRTSSSFCLSFRNASSYEKALSSTWWPSGVIVRQFKQSVGKRLQAASRKRHFKHIDSWSYERPAKPRYHRNQRHDLYYRRDGWDCVGHNNEYDRFGCIATDILVSCGGDLVIVLAFFYDGIKLCHI